MNPNAPATTPQAYTVAELAEALRCSPSFLYLEVSRGRLHPLKLGRKTVITAVEKARYERALQPFVSRARPRTTSRSA